MPWVRAKGWLRSKTIGVFGIAALIGIGDAATKYEVIPPEYVGVVVAFMSALAMLLRTITDKPLSVHPFKDGGSFVEAAPKGLDG